MESIALAILVPEMKWIRSAGGMSFQCCLGAQNTAKSFLFWWQLEGKPERLTITSYLHSWAQKSIGSPWACISRLACYSSLQGRVDLPNKIWDRKLLCSSETQSFLSTQGKWFSWVCPSAACQCAAPVCNNIPGTGGEWTAKCLLHKERTEGRRKGVDEGMYWRQEAERKVVEGKEGEPREKPLLSRIKSVLQCLEHLNPTLKKKKINPLSPTGV